MAQLYWILLAAIVGFIVPFVFGDMKNLPVDLYYLIYFIAVGIFFTVYVKQTGLDLKKTVTINLVLGIILGFVFAFIQAKNVFSRPATHQLTGGMLLWAIFWRGLMYGIVDGLLLSVFPYVVTWRAFDVANKPLLAKVGFTVLAWVFVLFVTTAYHLGYKDFRSKKIIQPNIGNSLISIPTFLSSNPVASPITHAGMHIAAVLHAPETDLFLPPHR